VRVAIVVFDGFNELDAFIALGLIGRLGTEGWRVELACPASRVTSMNGVVVEAQQPLEFANEADAVIFGSGIYTRAIADSFGKRGSLLDRLQLDPVRQTIGGQCSGVLLMARLGLLADQPAATDLTTRPWLMEAGVRVDDSPFRARGHIATAGGCLASQYLSAWAMVRGAGWGAAGRALHYAAPVGEKESYVKRVLEVIRPFVGEAAD